MNKRGNVFLIVLFIAAAIGGYLIYSGKINFPQKQITQTETSKDEETAIWKTYTDEGNKFSFKYPNDWEYETKTYDGGGGDYIRFFQTGEEKDFTQMMHRGNEQLTVGIRVDQSFEELKKQLKLSTPETVLDGRRVLKYETGAYILLNDSNNKILSVHRAIYPDEKDYLNKILSTFKFLDQSDTEGKFCGGIAANLPENQCPEGYKCQLDGNYPDASGKCVKK